MPLIFSNEADDMTSTAHEHLGDLFDENELLFSHAEPTAAVEEFRYHGCRTDIVACHFTRDLERREQLLGDLQPLAERRYRRSYRQIQRAEPISKDEWVYEDNTYVEDTARETWVWLERHGYLRPVSALEDEEKDIDDREEDEHEHEFGDIQPDFVSPDTEHVAVEYPFHVKPFAFELKQRDWFRALSQAMRAVCYTPYRFVVMDAGAPTLDEAEEHAEMFEKAGVGLLSLDRDGFEVLVKPDIDMKTHRPLKTATLHRLNEYALADRMGYWDEGEDGGGGGA